jgi:queuine/archaeosine tRNA-ribosyltransferase
MTIHNLAFYLDTLKGVREAIALGRFEDYRREMARTLEAPTPSAPPSADPDGT